MTVRTFPVRYRFGAGGKMMKKHETCQSRGQYNTLCVGYPIPVLFDTWMMQIVDGTKKIYALQLR
jgi:hypothetical protein